MNSNIVIENKYNPVKIATWALFACVLERIIGNILHIQDPLDWLFMAGFIYILLKNFSNILDKKDINKAGLYLVIIFISWLFIESIRAILLAEGYFVWKSVTKQFLLLFFYLIIIVSVNVDVVKEYYGLYWKYFIPLTVISGLFWETPLLYDYTPFSTLMLFFILVPKSKRWYLIGIVAFCYYEIQQRNDMAKVLIACGIGLLISYFYNIIPKWSIKLTHLSFLIAPFLFVWLATADIFNVFDFQDYIGGDYEQTVTTSEGTEEENWEADTRTPLFRNVFYTMEKYDAWVFGRSPAFGDEGLNESWGVDEDTGVVGRFGNEVGILDILLWFGMIGVILYFLIYAWASYLAIYKSKNRFAKGIGIYVAFLWMWSFIWEKPAWEIYFMTDLMMLGLCFSKKFRQLTDDELELWVKGIFIHEPKIKTIQYENSVDIERFVS